MAKNLLEMKDIIKEFPGGVRALDHVDLQVEEGSIHALCGENGAGKSTLMNVLSGIYPYGTYEGDIIYDGQPCKFQTIRDSEKKGIVIIHQELALVPYLSVMENMFLGSECQSHGLVNWEECHQKAVDLMKRIGLDVSPGIPVNKLGVGQQQLIEIAKALAKDVRLLILDEPTASLNDEDSEKLLNLILELRKNLKITAIIISHKLNEITKVADRITIIRDGRTIETLTKGVDDISEDRIIKGMVGREITNRYPERLPGTTIGDTCFEVKDWTVWSPYVAGKLVVDHVNFHVRRGEVVGIAGLMGAGRTELAMSLFGRAYGRNISGQIFKDGKELHLKSVVDAIEAGLAYATEDRKGNGLVLMESIRENITLPTIGRLAKGGVIDENQEVCVAEDYMKRLKIKAPGIFQKTRNLSGGNQQKVMLARWIYADPDILILDEPTRGIDVGAKYEIYCIINELAKKGKSVIVISSEMPEVLGVSDRIYVMNEGRFVGELTREQASQEAIMKYIMDANAGETPRKAS
ncbi:multiple monosaccharide ABC transporter ATP-binding protein [Selenomonas sp.]|uniref:multiple monosaccharide ABC transporter ATP-binding protein n=1 Tax=Selenomonas sp. TaxID=2053611 RepID=UPI0025E2D338|nr:multiple monosaccharide ABC transporter ATP-binding protein [Selenomonas sp.]MCI6084996.1 ATP-binding cassette domain-containing protein [Selenomonas sp.]MDY3296777.1 multiple monosaccharide ABC transporter ATP-binding protein [Selenomonas sp.]MDY4415993.1 multiple monosaccharide ABC transporter ATP-binding protein [Selenomonas sp.]